MREQNPDLIRLVAARYREMQGLLTMIDGGWAIYLGVLMLIAGRLDALNVGSWLLASIGGPLLILLIALPIVQLRWLQPRDWPYRWHWLPCLVVTMMTAVSMSEMPSYHVALRHLAGWCVGVGVAMACGGLGDHLILVRVLRPFAGNAAAGEEAS